MITQCPKTGRTCEVTGCDGCWKAEQAEQEPVAWIKLNEDGVYIEDVTGFPVYAAPVEPVKQEPVAVVEPFYIRQLDDELELGAKLYTHPVRTKDLNDDEIWEALHDKGLMEGIRAVIAADREKNRG